MIYGRGAHGEPHYVTLYTILYTINLVNGVAKLIATQCVLHCASQSRLWSIAGRTVVSESEALYFDKTLNMFSVS